MEKLIYVLWSAPDRPRSVLNRALSGEVADRLASDRAVKRIQLNIRDDAVAAGRSIEQGENLPAAVISLWLPSAHAAARVDDVIRPHVGRIAAYSVVESTVLPHASPPAGGGRSEGFSQLAFFKRCTDLDHAQFLEIWMRRHTPVAIATQETFHYAQNIVSRAITDNAPAWDGIVDEWYPTEALTDPLVYWKAGGSPARQELNYQREMASVLRFADFAAMALIVTSAYRIGGWCDAAL
jgi:EthD domain